MCIYVPPITQAAQNSTNGQPAEMATKADKIPLAISLALTESDCDRIYTAGGGGYSHGELYLMMYVYLCPCSYDNSYNTS